ncbi:ATP-binding protein [Bacillus sp. MUM 13]|uniref:AAA family ATPase n=1 Tax=Bacillus sp. MUM 13 TaxID=1678001 RepID=UPI0008F58040|nr:ATP-binding protein [Bacillus sp. MUM 13]OIK10067.1 hypothetical protein BIV59_15135 [Bacillus sp. MUM 13]
MLITFNVKNFMSFRDATTLSLESEPITEHEDTHTFEHQETKLLKTAVIYGANASGKSNLLKAMKVMRDLILNSSKESTATEGINVTPFLLNTHSANEPTIFEIEFIHKDLIYRYGFSVDKKKVHEEWLYLKELKLFDRKGNKYDLPKSSPFHNEGKGLQAKTRDNALFLSVVANFNGKIALDIQSWIEDFKFISGMDNRSMNQIGDLLDKPSYKEKILKLIRAADIGIEDLKVEEIEYTFGDSVLPKNFKGQILYSVRKTFNEEEQEAGLQTFDVRLSESEGTKKFLALVGPIIEILENGGVLLVDELDAKLHPHLTRKIVEMFNSYDVNKSNAQLIYATHDVTNLTNKQFRRDQLWFVEKDRIGSSELFSLADFRDVDDKKIRKDASYAKDYMLGKYGAIPKFHSWKRALEDNNGES